MFTIVLFLIFLAVFLFLGWRITTSRKPPLTPPPARPASYVCPVCNELDCECHKESSP